MADVVLSALSIVSGCLVAPVDRLCGHVISYESDVRELDHEVQKLTNVRDEVQSSIDEALDSTKPIKAKVEKWVREVETVTKEARDVLDYDGRAEKTCFYGWLPNLKVRYHLSREARRKAEDIQRLIDRIPPGEVFDDPPPGLVDGASNVTSSAGGQGDTIFESRASILEDIMNALDDKEHKVIGVYGPSGVGKTTLLKEVEKKLREERRLFDMIINVEVSQTSDLDNIQGQIAYALKLDLTKTQSQPGRRHDLSKRLKSKPNEKVLIIFDNLLSKLDLGQVGIPWGDVSSKCKLLLTSRSKDVLEQDMGADQTFLLQGLEDNEAFRLFESKVGDKLKGNDELKSIADKVVKKLAGLPLLIISVATALSFSADSAWRTALTQIDDKNQKLKVTIVKLSYEHLQSEDAKYLFLLCGLIGGTIRVELLLVLAMGLGLFETFNKTVRELRDRLNNILIELRSACLLLDGGDDKEKVTIHDLYSEVVVSTPFGDLNPLMMNSNYGSWSKKKLEKCWAICLADVDRKTRDELMKCQFHHLKILMLSQLEGWRWMQEHEHEVGDCSGLPEFTYMKELRVLCLRSMDIARLPCSIGILGNLHSLSLDHCNVEDVAILGKLEALQILSFAWSTISRLPEEIGKLTNLRSLNLNHCYSLKIMPGALKGLINLEELHMKRSFDQWMGTRKKSSKLCVAGLAELKSLTKLASLEISIPDPIRLLKDGDLPFENLYKFWINIGHAREMEYEGLTTMNLNLEGCDSILSRKWVKKNLQKTQCLYISKLSEFKESPRELCTQGFREVKYLDIKDSPSIKYIADSSEGLPLPAFGKLESFFLDSLINLEKICRGPITPECFNKLKVVRVRRCDQLKYLWCLSDAQGLKQLEEIEVRECKSMQSIVTYDAGEGIVSTDDSVELPNVRRLRLLELPNMKSFCTKAKIAPEDTSIQVSLPHLESLEMVGLLGLEEILYSEHSLKYSSLRKLTIGESKSTLKSILKLDWTLKLPNLESMVIRSSPSAEVVFDLEELKVTKDVEILSRLTWLTLDQLPKLQRMCKQDVKLQGISILRNLRDLYIYKTGLSFLFSVSVAKCFKEIRTITVSGCPNMKAVIVDEGRNEETYDIIEFPRLEYLSIWECRVEKFFSYPCGKKETVTATSDSQDANSNSFFDQKVTFPNITVLEINGLLCKELWNDQIPTDSFQKLESLKLENCDNLRRIAPPQMWKVLQHCLKNLDVISCCFIKIIYEGHGMDIEGGELRELLLRDLENMEHIWQSEDLPNVPFPNLIDVEAVRCPRLKVLFTTFTVKFLGQIKELVVESCEDMKEIAGDEKGEERTGTTVSFSNLTVLRLFKLPNFSGFLPGNYPLNFIDSEDYFPSLKVYSIKSCGAWNQFCGDWKGYKIERERREFFRFRGWLVRGLRGSSSPPYSPSSYTPFTNSTRFDEERRARMWSLSDSDSSGDSD